MRKILIALTTLAMMSSAVYAEEKTEKQESKLKVVSIGQQIRTQNDSGGSDIDLFHFGNAIAFKYGEDWTFDVFARKSWNVDGKDGIHGFDHRLEFNSWKKVNDNFSYGFRYRGQKSMDRYTVRAKYSYGRFSGWGDIAYQSNNGDSDREDAYYAEAEPLWVDFGVIRLGYYIEVDTWAVNTKKGVGNPGEAGFKHHYRQQLRSVIPAYHGEKLNLWLSVNWQFDTDRDYDKKKREESLGKKNVGWKEENKDYIGLGLMWRYQYNESLSFEGYMTWAKKHYDAKGGKADTDSKRYNVETQTGWTYRF